MAKLDDLIIANVKERLLSPDRLTEILESIIDKRTVQDRAVADRRTSLEASLSQARDKLARLYKAIEDGIVDLDDELKGRINALKDERGLIEASIERLVVQERTKVEITPAKITAFGELMRAKLDAGDTQARKAYLRSVISRIEVDDQAVRIIGEKAALALSLIHI